MTNFKPPKTILGDILVRSKKGTKKYFIGNAKFSIEEIGNNKLINIWAESYHFENHNGIEVKIGDVGFELMQPLENSFEYDEFNRINFPSEINKVESNWEELYYGHFYNFEHLKITNWYIELSPVNDLYEIKINGSITDDISIITENHFIESTFRVRMDKIIVSRYNWKYSKPN